jgi:hypothetical protein
MMKNCKNCTRHSYDENPCSVYRGWHCAAAMWDERGNEDHREGDNDAVWEGCVHFEMREGR